MPSSLVPFLLYSSAVAGASAYAYNNEQILLLILSQPQSYLYGLAAVVALIGFILLPSFVDEGRVGGVTGLLKTKAKGEVDNKAEEYLSLFGSDSRKGGEEHEALVDERKKNYTTVANHLYDLVTDFYEYGWGQSFHFANRFINESFAESIRRAEYYLALRLHIQPGHKVADIGCGVGGPLRNIAKFTGAHVTGINNNQYQLDVAERYNKAEGLAKQTATLKCDFMNIPVPEGTFDAAYEIEATCHAPDKVGCYSEICRILKPGGYFAGYEWCVTPSYDPKNPKHVAIKQGIEVGNGLPTLATYDEVKDALKQAGFEVIEAFNLHTDAHAVNNIPWYDSLDGKRLSNFRMTRFGRIVTHTFVSTLEFLRIAPKGSAKVSALLNATALDLVDGGRLDVFTPDYFFVARKPLKK